METDAQDVETVLIVEADLNASAILRDRLVSAGYRVHEAHSGPAAVALAASEEHHAVILDLALPDWDGLEVLRYLKEIDVRLMPIVLMDEAHAEVKKQIVDLGVFASLLKPHNEQQLHALLSWAVQVNKRARKGQERQLTVSC